MDLIKKTYLFLLLTALSNAGVCTALPKEIQAKGFVYLHEVDPTILISVRYSTPENFLGKPVEGYKKSVIIVTKQTAEALKKVQEAVKKDGYSLVIYDAYRPQMAVDNFIHWSTDLNDQTRKNQYYPRVDKEKVFDLGYVAKRSGHSRGSTVDLTLIKDGQKLHAIKEKNRTLLDGYTIKFLDDGTLDMGSSFDLFDTASHYENNLIPEIFQKRRTYLKNIMEQHGFEGYSEEWWHFTLKDEPFNADQDTSYFNFVVE